MDSFDSGLDTRSVNFLPFLAFFKLDQLGLERSASWIWGTGIGVWGTCNLWIWICDNIKFWYHWTPSFSKMNHICWDVGEVFLYTSLSTWYISALLWTKVEIHPSIQSHLIYIDISEPPAFDKYIISWVVEALCLCWCPHISVFVIGFMWTCLFVHIKWLYSSLLSVCNCVPFTRCIIGFVWRAPVTISRGVGTFITERWGELVTQRKVCYCQISHCTPSTSSVPNSSDGLIFVKRRALDGPFLDKNTGFRRAHRRAKFTFLIFFFLSKFAKKVKIEQNLFFSNAGQGGHHKIKCMEILRRPKLHLNVKRSSQAGSQWWIPSERAQNHM